MTIRDALKKYSDIEIDILLSHVLKKPKEFVFSYAEKSLSANQLISLSVLVRRRRRGEPIAYLVGYKDFCGLRFKVNKNVLIPRPETEDVVNQILDLRFEIYDWKMPVRILDVGTGSGCVAVSLAKQFSIFNFPPKGESSFGGQFSITGADVSKKALAIARQNARLHGVAVKFIHSDLLRNIKFTPDIIVANLPYGWTGVRNRFSSVKDGLKFEPKQALFTKEKGLYLIRRLLEQVAEKSLKPKIIFLEFDPRQKNELLKLIKKTLPGSKTEFHKDFRSLWRYVTIRPKEA